MRLASFNIENLFDRAKALNKDDWSKGRPALDAYQELNELFDKPTYTDADKQRILELLRAQRMLNQDEGPLLLLRKIRGQLLKRPRTGAVTVVAEGRSSWIGWVELKTEPVKETATENTARVVGAVGADVLGVVEAEDRTVLRQFNKDVLPAVGITPYEHVMLIDGNDERGIDLGIMTRRDFVITSIRSHVDDVDAKGEVFSRDCPEYEIRTPSGNTLWVLLNHFKSKGYGNQSDNDEKRKRQAQRVREIYDAHTTAGDKLVAVIGDLNDTPDSDPLSPLLAAGSTLRDMSRHSTYDAQGRPGTHGNSTASSKLDYILLSPDLFDKTTQVGVERRGMWGGKNGTLWPHFPELKSAKDAASDHAALWVDLDI